VQKRPSVSDMNESNQVSSFPQATYRCSREGERDTHRDTQREKHTDRDNATERERREGGGDGDVRGDWREGDHLLSQVVCACVHVCVCVCVCVCVRERERGC